MNRVFRVVWNSSQQTWAVASELAATAGKSSRAVSTASALVLLSGVASAACTLTGTDYVCTSAGGAQTTTVGAGYGTPLGTTVDVQQNAVVSTDGLPAISLQSGGSITVRSGATAENNAVGLTDGLYTTGANTVEFLHNNTLTIEQGAQVLSKGTAGNAEAINPIGTGNTIINNGTIDSQAGGAAIWFESTFGSNTVVNGETGVIRYKDGTNGNIIGVNGTMAINFTNKGQILGSLNFADGDDTLNLYEHGTISGAINGGGGNNLLTLNGTGTGTFNHAISNFQSLVKNDSGTWNLGISLQDSGFTNARVAGGTLVLATDTSNYTGTMTVDPAGTLQTPAEFAPLAVTNNGLVRFAQPTDATYNGLLSGTGGLEKTGAGTLTLAKAQAITGTTTVTAGTLKAGAADTFSAGSAHVVAAGATLDTAGFNQTVASLQNAGTVSLLSATPGSTLTVNGAYVGQGGVLSLGTVLGGSGSLSDRLVLNGPSASASGTTTIRVTNLGGLGAQTTGNGIEVVTALSGATTTAQTTKSAFTLANGHVDAGAFEYRLYAADAQGAGENWYLRTDVQVKPPVTPPVLPEVTPDPAPEGSPKPPVETVPGPTVTAYRAEVPLFAALPAQLRQADLAMLGNLHRRVGDESAPSAAVAGSGDAGRQAWARAVYADLDIHQDGVADASSKGHVSGLQAGTDLFAAGPWRGGVYVGYLDGGADVTGNARGTIGRVGSNDLQSRYLGGYATWMDGSGWYADAVLQGGSHRYTVRPDLNLSASGKADSLTASIETGKAFALTERWTIEPQAQLAWQRSSFDNVLISGAAVRQDADSGWIGRVGVRVKGDFATSAGRLQPYGRVNLYHAGSGTDVATFASPAASTAIASATGYTSAEVAGGATLALSSSTTLYGEVGHVFDIGGDARVKSSVQGSIGVRLSW
ncbi:autotransporter outer membrane beta-barrel domain-containing protein [Variovorax sp. Sphag1AA]|uniref:autotransporter outer membrane beta-barrel domain-containing protein n=1 Tax=Variovorax sp. Sphag1AA TaxID=2587027 RepID=UPI001613CFB1|nr:autotransporter outer membrane beta-barrel domain-containing protein [Variovorax sp. Sphag1AA]MBB3175701.1 outer membrane autotransporter protein [Variovorax sp. Sphag1AA]